MKLSAVLLLLVSTLWAQDTGYVIRKDVNEVNLPVTVTDQKHRLITNLTAKDFQVFEDDRPQPVTLLRREDIPVSLGIVVDNSGSMRNKRDAVTKAVINLIKASNPQDEAFVVNFNDEPFIDEDFTNNLELLHDALDRLDSRGETALYDAIIASADHLKSGKRERKILLVVTDGEDNVSNTTLEHAIRTVEAHNGPAIYCIGILGDLGGQHRARRALENFASHTGGVAYFPKNLTEVDAVSQEVAKDIRNQYFLTYKSSNPLSNGGYRKIRVMVQGHRDYVVRAREGYVAK